jgi:hypothetical protein
MKEWIFSTNIFLTVTEYSYFLAVEISTFHDNVLAAGVADADIKVLYDKFHPIHLALLSDYNNWKVQGDTQQGKSLSLRQLLSELSGTKIQDWDIQVQNIYKQNTPEYKILLPNHRIPFQTGTQTERIQTVKSLGTKLGSYASLATLKTDVDAFYTQLNDAFNNQKSNISGTKTQSSAVETSRVAMCVAQYANLGLLMDKYAGTPEKVANYFDLENIRKTKQTVYTGHIKPGVADTIAKHTFAAGDEVYLENTGTTTLQFYLAATKDAMPGTKTYTLASGNATVAIGELGDVANAFVTVYNPDANNTGGFYVELI